MRRSRSRRRGTGCGCGCSLFPLVFVFWVVVAAVVFLRTCGRLWLPVTGVIDAPTRVDSLLTSEEACAYSILYNAPPASSTPRKLSYGFVDRWVFAPGATLTVGERTYEVLGTETHVFSGWERQRDRPWGDVWAQHPELHGFSPELDEVLLAHHRGEGETHDPWVRDAWLPCGEEVQLLVWLTGDYAVLYTDADHLDATLAERRLPPRED